MRERLQTLGQLVLWSLRDFVREPAVLFWTIGFPILMTLTLGQMAGRSHALRADVAVVAAPGEEARAQAWAAQAPAQDRIRWIVVAEGDLARQLALGKARLGLEHAWDPVARRWRYDPANSEAHLAYHELRDLLEKRPVDTEPLRVPGSRYIDFLLPGLLALGLVNSCLWGIGWGLIEMRQKRLLRLMLATPLRPSDFFLSIFVARALLALGEGAILFGFSAGVFGVRVHGSWLALAALWGSGLAAFFGLAVLVACRSDRSAVGQGLINAITLPMFVVSGVFFGLDNFPPALQAVFRLFPPTLLVDGSRAVINGGAGLPEVLPACAGLLALAALFYGLGRRWFRFY